MPEALLEIDGIETCYGRSQVLFGISIAVGKG
jgi:ABC-type branched-subunit amino acid transport system ATPase component